VVCFIYCLEYQVKTSKMGRWDLSTWTWGITFGRAWKNPGPVAQGKQILLVGKGHNNMEVWWSSGQVKLAPVVLFELLSTQKQVHNKMKQDEQNNELKVSIDCPVYFTVYCSLSLSSIFHLQSWTKVLGQICFFNDFVHMPDANLTSPV